MTTALRFNSKEELVPLKVRLVIKESGNINPNRMYHLYDIENKRFCVNNLLKEEVNNMCKCLKLELVQETESKGQD